MLETVRKGSAELKFRSLMKVCWQVGALAAVFPVRVEGHEAGSASTGEKWIQLLLQEGNAAADMKGQESKTPQPLSVPAHFCQETKDTRP